MSHPFINMPTNWGISWHFSFLIHFELQPLRYTSTHQISDPDDGEMTGEKLRLPPGPAAHISETICKDDASISWRSVPVPIDPNWAEGFFEAASVEARPVVEDVESYSYTYQILPIKSSK